MIHSIGQSLLDSYVGIVEEPVSFCHIRQLLNTLGQHNVADILQCFPELLVQRPLANSILEAHISDTEEEENTQSLLEAKQAELARLHKKMDAYIEMRAEGDLSREMFRSKCNEVEPKINRLQEEIKTLSAAVKPKAVQDYTEKLTVLQYALERYTNIDEGQNVPDSVIEAFVVKIVVSKDGFDWYLRFDGDPDKPLHCQLSGKRKTNTKIMVSGDISPTMDNSTTGSDQGRQELICNVAVFPSVLI